MRYYFSPQLPVCFPDVDGVLIFDIMLLCLLIKKVKEIFHSWWNNMVWIKYTMEKVIYKLLKCSLKGEKHTHSTNIKKSGYGVKCNIFQQILSIYMAAS